MGVRHMVRRQRFGALLIVALIAACGAPGASSSPGVSGTPAASLPSPTASPSAAAPTERPTPSAAPSPTLAPASPSPTVAPTPSPTPDTMIVRAYFLLHDPYGGDPALVPVLRTVPRSSATARAAMAALLAGPSARERAALPYVKTVVPAGSRLLGIGISGGVATVDLSAEFASFSPDDAWDLGMFELRGRLAQVVYTLTQFPTVDRVAFRLAGKPVKELSGMADPEDGTSQAIALDGPVSRATYRDRFLPPIFVDRPAWGAALPTPGRVTGLASVFEAQFRMALRDRNDKVLVDVPVVASGETGAWAPFDVTLSYHVSTAQWGTLRVWDVSEADGHAIAVREYPVYLRPAP